MDALDGRKAGIGFTGISDASDAAMQLPAHGGGFRVTVSPGVIQVKGKSPFRTAGGGGRANIREWSRSSRANMVKTVASLDLTPMDGLAGYPAMVTLTLPGDWEVVAPTAAVFKADFKEWRKRYARRWGVRWVGLWKLEFQRRGAPHLHLYQVVPSDPEFPSWCSQSWADVVNHPDPVQRANHARAGTRVDVMKGARASDPRRLAVYFGKHSAPGGEADKEYQHTVPQLWLDNGGPGRFWGYIGLEKACVTREIGLDEFIEIRRWLRKAQRSIRGVTIPKHRRDTRKPLVDNRTRKISVRTQVLRSDYKRCETVELAPGVLAGHRRTYTRMVTRYRNPAALTKDGQGGFVLFNDAPAVTRAIARGLQQR